VLAASLVAWDGRPNCDCELLLVYGMLALGFPASIVATGAIALLYQTSQQWFGTTVTVSRAEMSMAWAWLALAGYWQWFGLVPWAARRIRGQPAREA
jgi:hypothetical protein